MINTEFSFSDDEISKVGKFASEKHASVLTLVMSDISGSVIMGQEMGSIYRGLKIKYHDKPLFDIITRQNKGIVVKSRGDGFLCIFAEPSVAVERALEIQQYFEEDGHFDLRIGIAMGQVKLDDDVCPDIISMHANIAARAESLCEPGHVLVTRSVFESASNWIPKSQCSWKNQGYWALKYGEEFIEYIEPYNANAISPMKTLPKGTKSRVPTFENYNVYAANTLTSLVGKAIAYPLLFLWTFFHIFTKKAGTPQNSLQRLGETRSVGTDLRKTPVLRVYENNNIRNRLFEAGRSIRRANREKGFSWCSGTRKKAFIPYGVFTGNNAQAIVRYSDAA